MNRKIVFAAFLLIIAVFIFIAGCTQKEIANTPNPSSQQLIIKTGTSFGECVGYCKKELVITSEKMTYIKSSWDGSTPEVRNELVTSSEKWNILINNLKEDKFNSLPEVIGCPDCADGGAEWIEIFDGKTNKKVTFEYGASISEIDSLVKELREIRNDITS